MTSGPIARNHWRGTSWHALVAEPTPPELAELRHSIDNIDAAILHLLAERFKCTRKVGELKARLDLPPADPVREAQQIARLRSLAVSADLDPEFAEKFLNFLVREVIRHHEVIRADRAGSIPSHIRRWASGSPSGVCGRSNPARSAATRCAVRDPRPTASRRPRT